MGTSVSFLSPRTPRWQALDRGIQLGFPTETLRAMLFSAAAPSWAEEIAHPSMAAWVDAVGRAHNDLAVRLRENANPAAAIGTVVKEARSEALEAGGSAATGLAERALQVTLLARAGGQNPFAATSDEAVVAWTRQRGTPDDLVRAFAGEVFAQLARHVVARDLPVTLGGSGLPSLREARRVSDDLAAAARRVTEDLHPPAFGAGAAKTWRSLVESAFALGARAEGGGHA